MSSAAAKQPANTVPERADSIYTTRDDLARSFNPVTPHERMLVSAIAQAWERLQRAFDLEHRAFDQTDPLELINNDLDKFKAITRFVTDSERLYRRAIEELRRAQRNRQAPPAAQRTPKIVSVQRHPHSDPGDTLVSSSNPNPNPHPKTNGRPQIADPRDP